MNILSKIVLCTFTAIGFGPMLQAMKPANVGKRITQIKIDRGDIPQRIFLNPYQSTGMETTVKPYPIESKGLTISNLQRYAMIAGKVGNITHNLTEPFVITFVTQNPELFVAYTNPEGEFKGHQIFDEDGIKELSKDNQLVLTWNKVHENFDITLKPIKKQ